MKEINLRILEEKVIKEQGNLFGIFFEDLNHAADGGLYGELIRNRSFEFDHVDCESYHSLTAWDKLERGDSVAQAHIEAASPICPENPHYLTLEVMTKGQGGGIRNQGYNTGIPIEMGQTYKFSCFLRVKSGPVELEILLEDKNGEKCYAKQNVIVDSRAWKKYECSLYPDDTDYSARLSILSQKPAIVAIDMVSLFPANTYLNRENGMRADIAKLLADMKPRFMRFPGGCLVHIGSLDGRDRCGMYRWKNTLGPVEQRPSARNTWNYNQTFGLGFYEFFLFCEDIGAEPLPVIAAGYDPHYLREAPLDTMQEWIDEALDLIEFANGGIETQWGSVRARMGHPESFEMKYLGIGNEEVGDAFFQRYEIILNAVKDIYPEIQVIGSSGPGSGGSEFHKGWEQARRTRTSYVDEHFYQCPEWFLDNVDRYSNYPSTPKAFIGEYASHDDTWFNALAEAAFMTGLEKAEGVGLACYAPLLNNVDYSNWKPDLLYFDNHRVYGSPSYHVQKLFMNNHGDLLLGAVDDMPPSDEKMTELKGFLAMATRKAEVEIKDLAVTNLENGAEEFLPGFTLSEKDSYYKIADMDTAHYAVTFRFCKKNGGRSGNLNGAFSFDLEFAGRDEDNKFRWTIDGWQRLTSLFGICRGKSFDMGLHFMETKVGTEYEGKLIVDGNKISTYINGKLYCNHTLKSSNVKPLYYSVVKDKKGAIIVKVVNPDEEEKQLSIELGKSRKQGVEIHYMEGFTKDDRNSFQEPEKVIPKVKAIAIEDGKLEYKVKGLSIAVFRFH